MGGFIVGLMVISFLVNIMLSVLINFILFGGLFGFFFYRDNRDAVERKSKRSGIIKSRISSYSISEQRVRLTT